MLSHPSQEIHLHNTNTYKLAYNFISKFLRKNVIRQKKYKWTKKTRISLRIRLCLFCHKATF